MTFVSSAASVAPFLLVVFLAAAAISFLLTPPVRRIAIRLDAVDRPGHRRVNTSPIPRSGRPMRSTAMLSFMYNSTSPAPPNSNKAISFGVEGPARKTFPTRDIFPTWKG